MHCAQTAEDIDTVSFACDNPMSISYRVKMWLDPPPPVDLSIGDIRWQIAAEWL